MVATIVISVILAAVIAAVIRNMWKKKRIGGCGCGCSGCDGVCTDKKVK